MYVLHVSKSSVHLKKTGSGTGIWPLSSPTDPHTLFQPNVLRELKVNRTSKLQKDWRVLAWLSKRRMDPVPERGRGEDLPSQRLKP